MGKKGFENVGNGFINLANMLLVLFFLNHWLLENIEPSENEVFLMMISMFILYLSGFYLSNIGKDC